MNTYKHRWPEDLYVVIPSYKSSRLLTAFLPKLFEFTPPSNVCVVDDGSFDATDAVCKDADVLYISHDVNRGKGAALATGFTFLLGRGAQRIITMDADGQHAPEDLSVFIEASNTHDGNGLYIGARSMKIGTMPFARICSNRITSFILSQITGKKIVDSQCGYRLYGAALLDAVNIEYPRFEMESEVIIKAAFLHFPIHFIQVQTLYLNESSHISHLKDTIRWVKAVTHIWISLRRRSGTKQHKIKNPQL